MDYSTETRYAADAAAAEKDRSEDLRKREASQARCRQREESLGPMLDVMTAEQIEGLATRKYIYLPALELWRSAGRPLAGRHREDLLHQFDRELREAYAELRQRAGLERDPEVITALARYAAAGGSEG